MSEKNQKDILYDIKLPKLKIVKYIVLISAIIFTFISFFVNTGFQIATTILALILFIAYIVLIIISSKLESRDTKKSKDTK